MSYRSDRKRRHSIDRGVDSDLEWHDRAGSIGRAGSYDPIKVGSSDGMDDEPHDRGLVRAMNSKLKTTRDFQSDPRKTLFIGRLHPSTTEDDLRKQFERYGDIRSLYLIRDIITGDSRRYAFVEYRRSKEADRAYTEGHNLIIDGRRVLVDREFGRTMKGWKPRRLGGGFSGHKESGQFRFGGRPEHGSYRPMRSTTYHSSHHSSYRRNDFDDNARSRFHGSSSGGYGSSGGSYRTSSGPIRSRR